MNDHLQYQTVKAYANCLFRNFTLHVYTVIKQRLKYRRAELITADFKATVTAPAQRTHP